MAETKIVDIGEIREGMLLANDLINNFGQTLLPAGIELNKNHIKMLKTWNIGKITIMLEKGADDFKLTRELRKAAEEIILPRLDWEPENPYEQDLFEASIYLIAKNLSNKEKIEKSEKSE